MPKDTRSSKPKRSTSVRRSPQNDPIVFNFGGADIEVVFEGADPEETAPADSSPPQHPPSASVTPDLHE